MGRKPSTGKPGVVWEGAFTAKHSLALVNREIALEVVRRGNVDLGLVRRNDSAEMPSGRYAYLADLFDHRPERVSVTVRHFWPPTFERPAGGAFVLWQPWEFGSVPRKWIDAIAESVDEVWAYTEFVKTEYVESGVPEEKVKVVPLGVNPSAFNPDAPAGSLDTDKSFKFLFVGGTIPRKGIDILLTAYATEFSASDDVCLVIKDFGAKSFYKGQGYRQEIEELASRRDAPSVLYLDAEVEDDELPGLYRACDCLVHPYRGEGFGLPIAEAMACGLPVIVTEYGACLDFCSDETAYLIPATVGYLSEKRIGDLETVDYPFCAEPDTTAVRKLMRRVYENRDEARAKGLSASEHILASFTWEHTAAVIEERLIALAQTARVTTTSAKEDGLRAFQERRWSDAIRLLKDLPETDAGAMNALALAYHGIGDDRTARTILGKALEVTPDYATTYQNLAVLLARDGRALDAARNACRAVELDPSHSEAVAVLKKTRDMVRALKPAAKPKKGKRSKGPTQAEISSVLARVNSVLSQQTASRPGLSVCMIVRNEETFLDDCLKSVKGIADEVVVVDTGSTDRTTEIAKSHGAVIRSFAWTDSFSDARNKALEYTKGDWILHLDADERLDEQSRQAILDAVAGSEFDAFELVIRNYRSDGPNPDVLVHRTCRLYRNRPEYRYQGRVHERIVPSIEASGGKVGRLDAVIHHYGYRPSVVEERQKYDRYIKFLAAELEESPDNLHCLYNIGAAFSSAGDPENALTYLKRAADLVSPDQEYAPGIFAGMAGALCSMGKADEAVSVLEDAAQRGVRHPELDFCRGNSLLLLERYEEAISEFQAAIRNGRAGNWTGDTASFGYKAELGIASASAAMGDYRKAVESAQKVLLEKPDEARAHELLGRIFAQVERPDKAEKHLTQLLRLRPDDSQAAMRLADILYGQARYIEARARYTAVLHSGHDSADLRIRLGLCAGNLKEPEAAEEHFRRAIELKPDFIEAYLELGKLLGSRQRITEALDCLATAAEIDPTHANAYFAAADLLYNAGRYGDAAGVYQNALTHGPRNAAGFLALGNCYYQMGAYEAAQMAYRQALAIRPSYLEAENNLAMAEEAMTAQRKAA